MLTSIMSSSGYGRSEVASSPSPTRRQTNPGDASASALIGSSAETKSARSGVSSGSRIRPTLICARCQRDVMAETLALHRPVVGFPPRPGHIDAERAVAGDARERLPPLLERHPQAQRVARPGADGRERDHDLDDLDRR